MAKKNNKPVDEIPRGRMKLLQWENKKDGETFPSFSITKTDTKFDEEDKIIILKIVASNPVFKQLSQR